jgi:RNA polymerase sigma-70 factor (ECF subfamily)
VYPGFPEEPRPDPEALFHRYRNGIYSFIRRKGFSPEEADDLTQETLIRAFTHLGTFRGSSMDAWLYRIAANVAVDFLRKRRVQTVPIEGMTLVDHDQDPPGQNLVREERRARVLSVIDELPTCHQRILHLRYFEDRSLAEIAGTMNCTPMAAKLRVFRAVTALRKRWRTQGKDVELLAEA